MVMNFVLMSHANLINSAPGFYQVCAIFADIKKFSINLEIPHLFSYLFRKMSRVQNLSRKTVMGD